MAKLITDSRSRQHYYLHTHTHTRIHTETHHTHTHTHTSHVISSRRDPKPPSLSLQTDPSIPHQFSLFCKNNRPNKTLQGRQNLNLLATKVKIKNRKNKKTKYHLVPILVSGSWSSFARAIDMWAENFAAVVICSITHCHWENQRSQSHLLKKGALGRSLPPESRRNISASLKISPTTGAVVSSIALTVYGLHIPSLFMDSWRAVKTAEAIH